MSLTGRVARNTIIQVAGRMIGTVLGLIVVAMLTRYLGTTGYGQYTTVIAYLGFFSVVADLGLYLIVVREISKKDAVPEKVIGNVFSLRIIFAVAILGLAAFIAIFLDYPALVKQAIFLGTLSFIFVALNQVMIGIFQKALKMSKIVMAELLGRAVLLLASVIFIALKLDLLFIILAIILGSFANFILTYIFARAYVKIRFLFDFAYWRYILRETWPLAISVVLNLIYFRIDTVILSLMKPAADVGLYGVSYKILEVLVSLPNMFVGLALPILSYYAFLNPEKFAQVFRRAFDFIILVTLPIVTGGFILAKPIIELIAGQGFSRAAVIFQILIFAVGFLFLGSLSGHTIVAINKQRKMVWGYLAVAVFGLSLYLILIPIYSYIGAAIGTVLTEGMIAAIGYYIILKTQKFKLPYRMFLKSLVASLVMAGFLAAGKNFNILIQLAIGSAVYLTVMYLLKSFQKQEIIEIINIKDSQGNE